MMRDDPCFSCSLPDCDERDRGCKVRQLANQFDKLTREGRQGEASVQQREAAAHLYRMWDQERKAEASEGGRPYSHYKPAELS